MAEFSTEHKKELESLIERFVDPLSIFRKHVYDNSFVGSFSLKTVAPIILGESQSYNGMLVDSGSADQRTFEEIINPKTLVEHRKILIEASLEYCQKKTLMMVDLVKWLFKQ